MSETDFIRELVRRTGCGLLLDVNNVFVSATNHGFSALDYLADFPLEHVGEIHLAGHAEQADDEGDLLLIDSHDGPVADAVWKLFDIVIRQCGPIPTLVEWDSAIPDWPVLKAEADRRAGDPRPPRAELSRVPKPMLDRRIEKFVGEPVLRGRVFVPPLLDPDRATPDAVAGPNGKAATKRYNVYRNNVTVSLIDALAAVFPATLRITGEEFFRAMARFHVRATPPTSPLLFEYGRDFPDFIERYEYAQSMPWLADVARIERAWLDAYHAADAEPLAPQALASIRPERLADTVLTPHPATRIVRSRFPAVTIFAANRSDGPVGRIEASRAGGCAGDAAGSGGHRPAPAARRRGISDGLIAGEPLGAAAGSARRSSRLRSCRQHRRNDRGGRLCCRPSGRLMRMALEREIGGERQVVGDRGVRRTS